MHIADKILGELDSSLLEQQNSGAAAWAVEALGATFAQICPWRYAARIDVLHVTVTLHDIADHEGDDFYHGDQTDASAVCNFSVNDGYASLVF